MAKMKHAEDAEQEAVFEWANWAKWNGEKISQYLFAIPNGGKRNVREAARMKKQGVKAGVSDMFLPIPKKGFSGLWIELKAKNGNKPSEKQIIWINRMLSVGYQAQVCYGAGETIRAIENYLELNHGNI